MVFGMSVATSSVLNAQVIPAQLLEWTIQHLDNKDCEKAEETYKMYQEKVPEGSLEVERLIAKCREEQQQTEKDPTQQDISVQREHHKDKNAPNEKSKNENKFKDFLKDRNNPYCKAERNRYIAWTIVGAGYPWNVTMGVEMRGGGILGIGGYADIGVDISSYLYKYTLTNWQGSNNFKTRSDENIIQCHFKYIGGFRLFYKGLFLSLGYGSISRVKPVIFEGDNLDEDSYEEQRDEYLSKFEKGHGLHFNVGYNLCTTSWYGFFLGVSGGIAYDVVNKIVVPSFNLKLGMTFDWEQY